MKIAQEIYDKRFNDTTATPRSREYKQGVMDTLLFIYEGKLFKEVPYKAGTAQFDAYLAGYDYGKTLITNRKKS